MIDLPEFVMDADNVYRTSKYIVKFSINVQSAEIKNTSRFFTTESV